MSLSGQAAKSAATSISDEDVFGRVYDHGVVKRLIPYVMPQKYLILLAIMAMIVFAGSQVAVPWLIKIGIDKYIVSGDRSGLVLVGFFFFGNVLLNGVSNYIQQVSIGLAGQKVLFALRTAMFAHLQKMSLRFYDRSEVGRIMSRVQGDVFQLQECLSVAVSTLGDLLSLAGIITVVILMDVKLGLISMSVLPVLLIIMSMWQPSARRVFVNARRTISVLNGALNENISGIRVVQSMNRQTRNLEEFDTKNDENLRAYLSAGKLSNILLFPVDGLSALAIGLALFFGASMVTEKSLEIGALVAFVMYIQRFFDPIRSLTMQYTQLQRAMASGSRIFELLDQELDMMDVKDANGLPVLKGKVEFRNVTFGYSKENEVLLGTSFVVNPGETVAIVGPTGAGKTTLISLLARFYDVERGKGSVLVDDHDIRDWTRDSLVNQISVVLQEPFLFSGTVMENIRYNCPNTTHEDIIKAAQAVGAHSFITKLEDGYETFLEERGMNLSVGQRQLLSFARAIVRNPRILILDEATANVDSATELLIQKALKELLRGRTAILIAHRLSTIRGSDKILVLQNGEIVEQGNHAELMLASGLYTHLYQMNYAALESTDLAFSRKQ